MSEIKFKTEWLTQIALLAACGTPNDVADLCAAIQRASLDLPVNEMSPLTETLFQPIAESIKKDRAISETRSKAKKQNTNKIEQNTNKIEQNTNKTTTKTDKEVTEESREEKEEIPHTPLEVKEESKEEDIYNARAGATDKEIEAEFEEIWARYPKKAGKKDALRHYKAARKRGVAFDEILNGVRKYSESVAGRDERYILNGSTWFCGNRWEDDIHPAARTGPPDNVQRRLRPEEIAALPAIDPFAILNE